MGADTKIEWADHTFNPWMGCTKVSPACDHCYAEVSTPARALGVAWGANEERRRTSEATWRQPLAWNRKAAREGRRFRVFCASLADVFENQVPASWRVDLWTLIHDTPHLDWLLLTKRPQNIQRMLPPFGKPAWPWPNVWLGMTVENQAEADRRIPHLLAVPAVRRFLSCEPLLGPVDLRQWWRNDVPGGSYMHGNGLHWIIAGGESGPKARASHPDWFRSLRDQCEAAGVPFFFKQWGEWTRAHPQLSGTPGRYALAPRTYPGPPAQDTQVTLRFAPRQQRQRRSPWRPLLPLCRSWRRRGFLQRRRPAMPPR